MLRAQNLRRRLQRPMWLGLARRLRRDAELCMHSRQRVQHEGRRVERELLRATELQRRVQHDAQQRLRQARLQQVRSRPNLRCGQQQLLRIAHVRRRLRYDREQCLRFGQLRVSRQCDL